MPRTRILRENQTSDLRNGWIAVAIFAFIVALLGGSSRPDAVQIVALRPIAALFLIPAFYFASRENLREVRAPLTLLLLLTGLMLIQLVPLPAAIWQSLPGRGPLTVLSEITDTSAQWRPLTLVPARTLNALASLVVPVTGLLLLATLRVKRIEIFLLVAAIGVVNALLAIAQTVSGGNEALYPYAITNKMSAVGLFANQNHSSVFGAVTLLLLGYLLSDRLSRRWLQWQRAALFSAYILVLLFAITGGSRAGLISTIVAVMASAAMFWISIDRDGGSGDKPPMIFGRTLHPPIIFAGAAVMIALVIGAFLTLDRIPAFKALTDVGSFEDLRWRLLPTLREMIANYWMFGSGFGSFEEVYHIFEPSELLRPAYVNQAHNDWAQLLIEGGFLAALLAIATCAWALRQLLRFGGPVRQKMMMLVFWITLAIILIFASSVDYPLRTPLFQFVAAALLVGLCSAQSVGDDHRQKS